MNCKPGDLAIIVGDKYTNNNGKVVRCVSIRGNEICCDGVYIVWNIDRKLSPTHKGWVADSIMRPIRPDETPEESIESMRKLHDLTEKVNA